MDTTSPSTAASPSSPAPVPGSAAPRRSRWPGPAPRVVLNDLPGAADEAADEIRALGAEVAVVAGDVGERATADAMLDGGGRGARPARHRGQQRRHHPRQDAVQHDRRGVGPRPQGAPARPLPALAQRRGVLARRSRRRPASRSTAAVVNTASEAFLGGSPGQAELRRRQGRHHRAHPVDGARARPGRACAPTRSAPGPAPR